MQILACLDFCSDKLLWCYVMRCLCCVMRFCVVWWGACVMWWGACAMWWCACCVLRLPPYMLVLCDEAQWVGCLLWAGTHIQKHTHLHTLWHTHTYTRTHIHTHKHTHILVHTHRCWRDGDDYRGCEARSGMCLLLQYGQGHVHGGCVWSM